MPVPLMRRFRFFRGIVVAVLPSWPCKEPGEKEKQEPEGGDQQLAGTHTFGSSCSLFGGASVLGSLSGGGGIWIQSSYFSSALGEGGELLGHIVLELISAELVGG